MIIWITVGYAVVGNMLPEIRGKKQEAGTSDAQIEIIGKYVVGVHLIANRDASATQPASQASNAPTAALMAQLDQLVHSERNKLQAAIVAGEVMGDAAATERLNAIDLAKLDQRDQQDLADVQTIYATGTAATLSADARQRLEKDEGFFGRLALSRGHPPDDPLRSSIIKQCKKVVVALGAGTVAAVAGLVIGVILLVVAIVLLSTGAMKTKYVPPIAADVGTVFVEMFAVYILSFFLLSLGLGWLSGGETPMSWYWLLTIVLPVAALWGVVRGLTWQQIRSGLGWHTGAGWYIEIPCGIAGYLAGLPLLGIGFLISFGLMKLSGITPSHPIQSAPAANWSEILGLYGIAAVWAPVIEESMFRGALFSHLRRRWSWIASASLVAFIFAVIHPQGWTLVPALCAIALMLAAVREWRGSILASMAAHACNNALMITLLVALK